MAKRILICAYFSKNIGDDLFLKILIDRYPLVKWELLTANRDYQHTFKKYKNVKIIFSYREIKIGKSHLNLFVLLNNLYSFKKYDAIINIGGSIFMQNPAWKIRLEERKYLLEKIQAKKNFIIGANFGPYEDKQFIEEYRQLFPKYDDICFRDLYSYNLFKDFDNVRLAPDVVFNYKDVESNDQGKIVGFSTINLKNRVGLEKYREKYHEKIVALIENYIESGYKVKLFSFCENEGDLDAIGEIMKQLNSSSQNQVKVINYSGDIDLFIEEFKSCEQIIGSRLHSLILSMVFNKSFYPLIYSDKTKHILEDLMIRNKGSHIRDIDNLDITKTIDIAKDNRLTSTHLLVDASEQFREIDAFILEGG